MTPADEQYGSSGYNQLDGYGANPYEQRDNDQQGGRFNNYSQGRYDDRMCPSLFSFVFPRQRVLTHHSWSRDAVVRRLRRRC